MFEPLRDQPLHIHITIGETRQSDPALFFGQSSFNPESRYIHFHFADKLDWQSLGLFLRWFPSKSQAAKQGWKGDLPWGYSEHRKGLIRLFILNLEPGHPKTAELELRNKL